MYNERKAVFSLNLYSQHVGVAPQGMQVSSTGRTPAFPVTCPIQSHPDPHGFGCCLSLTLMESAVKKHVVVERLVAADASKCVHYQDSGNNQAPVDLLTQKIHCAVAMEKLSSRGSSTASHCPQHTVSVAILHLPTFLFSSACTCTQRG